MQGHIVSVFHPFIQQNARYWDWLFSLLKNTTKDRGKKYIDSCILVLSNLTPTESLTRQHHVFSSTCFICFHSCLREMLSNLIACWRMHQRWHGLMTTMSLFPSLQAAPLLPLHLPLVAMHQPQWLLVCIGLLKSVNPSMCILEAAEASNTLLSQHWPPNTKLQVATSSVVFHTRLSSM